MVMIKRERNVKRLESINPKSLWYAPDRRIRTTAAAKRAVAISQWVASDRPEAELPDEQALFAAMHACAFRAVRGGGKSRPLSAAQRNAWVDRWRAIRDYLVETNLGLVYSTIGRFNSRKIDEDDLLSDAMLALSRAIDRFNPWRGFRFSTYACNVIVRSLMRRGRVESNYRRLFPVQHEAGLERADGLPDEQKELYVERLRRVMDANLGDLSDLEYRILEQRFPAEQGRPLTFQKIGAGIGLSKERVRQIQNVALRKLRDVLQEDPILQ